MKPITMVKRCKLCGNKHLKWEFGKDSTTPDGLKRSSKKCLNAYNRKNYHDNIDARRKYHRAYQRKRRKKDD